MCPVLAWMIQLNSLSYCGILMGSPKVLKILGPHSETSISYIQHVIYWCVLLDIALILAINVNHCCTWNNVKRESMLYVNRCSFQHGNDSANPLPFCHVDIAGSSGLPPKPPTGAPLIAFAHSFILNRESPATAVPTEMEHLLYHV